MSMQVMRMQPFCSISNRTGLGLQLLQWQPSLCAQHYDDQAGGGTAVQNSIRGLPRAQGRSSLGPLSMGNATKDSSVDWTSCMELPAGMHLIHLSDPGQHVSCVVVDCTYALRLMFASLMAVTARMKLNRYRALLCMANSVPRFILLDAVNCLQVWRTKQ